MIQQITVHQTEQIIVYVPLGSHKSKVKHVTLNASEVSFVFFDYRKYLCSFLPHLLPCKNCMTEFFRTFTHLKEPKFPQICFFCWLNLSVATINNLRTDFHHQDKKTACSVEVCLKKKCTKKSSLQKEMTNEASSVVIYFMVHKLRTLAPWTKGIFNVEKL